MHRIAVRLSLALAFAALPALAGLSRPHAARAQATTDTLHQVIQITTTQFVPCANDGAGELVELSGELRLLLHLTMNDNHLAAIFRSQPHLVGTGLTTGDTYHLAGPETNVTSLQLDGGTSVSTLVDNFRLIGPGPDNNLLVRLTSHATFNNNGELTSSHTTFDTDCK